MRGVVSSLFGIRYDVDLGQRWWHRLSKVVYVVFLFLLVGVCWLVLSGTQPEANSSNVVVKDSLALNLALADKSVPNILPGFLAQPGRLGAFVKGGRDKIDWASEYALEHSWCTADAPRLAEQIAKHLNERSYGQHNTAASVLADIKKAQTSPDQTAFCWFDSGIREYGVDQIIKYDFTERARLTATMQALGTAALIIFLVNLVLLNLYYRGLVCVVVGPRKSPRIDEAGSDDTRI
jgi:hypothetical protein